LEMRKKHRIILILIVGALVGSLVITASFSGREGVSPDMSPLDQACLAGENLLIKLGLLPLRSNAARDACIANLKQIDGAKATWALEQKKTSTDVPALTELQGSSSYIREQPYCPSNGSHDPQQVQLMPTCTQAPTTGHTL
ncbi:MAG TPA: hypothetical protein VFT34_13450, partial [Verrucomicrobiae bacterium]|nr:hypothetical protein [Verrucomicrobiae bacterium]